jgi:negative regulator of flagellin synthesis FlgM
VKIDPNVTSTPDSASSLTGGAQRTAQGDASTQVSQAPANTSSAATGAAAASTAAADASVADQVNISSLSAQLNASFAGNTGDVDTKRVSELKEAISKGNLSVDSSKIADGLLDTVRGLLQQQPQQQQQQQ